MMGHNGGNQSRLFRSTFSTTFLPIICFAALISFLTLSDLRAYVTPFYSLTGRSHRSIRS